MPDGDLTFATRTQPTFNQPALETWNELEAPSTRFITRGELPPIARDVPISAIPIVEAVIGSIQTIVNKTADVAPTYSRNAGLGYGMATYHQSWEATDLPTVIGQLLYTHRTFGISLAIWEKRLSSLLAVSDQIRGSRAAAEAA